MQMKLDIRKKLNIQKVARRLVAAAAFMLFIQLGISMEVHAADGNLSIAVSSSSVEVGDTVKVTLRASGPNREGAAADMQFTYDSSVFSFVSCDQDNYSGGEGGQVNVTGSTVNVTLKAVSEGSSKLKVTGSNGTLNDSQEALDSMTAAGATISAAGGTGSTEGNTNTGSGDNSLSELTLSAGQLSPAFVYSTTEYSASVSYDTTSIEVNAKPTNGKAKVSSISGNDQLQVGENTISVTVEAENGAKAVYKIVVTRAAEEAASDQTAAEGANTGTSGADGTEQGGNKAEQTQSEETMDSAQEEEYQARISLLEEDNRTLNEKYKSEKSFARKMMAILIFIIVVLIILCVNLMLFMKRRNEKEDDWEFADDGESDSETDLINRKDGMGDRKSRTEEEKKRAKSDEEAFEDAKESDGIKESDDIKESEDQEDWLDEDDWLDQEDEKKDLEIEFINLDDL